MKCQNKFSQHYSELLEGEYDCIDRILLNAYYPKLLSGGGLRDWWRQLHGDDSNLSTASLMRMPGAVSKRIQSYCKQKNIPFIHYQAGERKHEDAAKLYPEDASFEGIFAIFCSRATSLLWEVHSVYQVEYSRNFLFKRGRQLDEAYQHIINLTRHRIDMSYLKTLLGRKTRPYKTKTHTSARRYRFRDLITT